MARKSSTLIQADEDTAILLSQNFSDLVLFIARKRGYSQATLAEKLGYSRASLNQILNSTTSARLWRLPGMCAAARVLEIPLSDLIAQANSLMRSGGSTRRAIFRKQEIAEEKAQLKTRWMELRKMEKELEEELE